jgi:hypothetical protein
MFLAFEGKRRPQTLTDLRLQALDLQAETGEYLHPPKTQPAQKIGSSRFTGEGRLDLQKEIGRWRGLELVD